MCIFISVVVPATTPETELRTVMNEFLMGCRPCDDPVLTDRLAVGERAFYTTKGHCSCGTLLASQRNPAVQQAKDAAQIATDEAKKRKAGWSETRIMRWRQEREADLDKREEQAEIRGQGYGEIARFMDFVRAILNRGIAPCVGFYHRTYGGSDKYPPFTRRIVRIASMSPNDFLRMPENVLTQFAA
ncbi:MAG: hypothetical protein H7Y38_17165 [Armatimonadetes bacterium]|nr:hypothetical protein [Armatimonadota bacterium]